MDKFWITKQLGGGSFGTVFEAWHQPTGEVVAVKYLRETFSSFEQCLSLPEVQSLSKLRHPNIVQLKDVILEYDSAFLVFEYMQSSLLDLMMKRRTKFTEEEVRSICYQMFRGLAYMHKEGYFHRDLKPANVLVNDGARVVKIADLGSAKEIDSPPPYTDYVTTRPYRAPEVLLQSGLYGPKVDMWAMGAIMAELFSFWPLFPGQSPDDQMFKICSVIGSPTRESWPEGQLLAQNLNYQFPQLHGVGLPTMIPSASRSAIQLISSLCSWDPSARPTADEVLRHPFFVGNYKIPRAIPWRQSNILPASNSIIFCSFATSDLVLDCF